MILLMQSTITVKVGNVYDFSCYNLAYAMVVKTVKSNSSQTSSKYFLC